MPHRITLSRKRGWRMPPNCRKVDRTTKFGNPFRVGGTVSLDSDGDQYSVSIDAKGCVRLFELWLANDPVGQAVAEMARRELRGMDLACWCRQVDDQGKPVQCDASVLLRIANEG